MKIIPFPEARGAHEHEEIPQPQYGLPCTLKITPGGTTRYATCKTCFRPFTVRS